VLGDDDLGMDVELAFLNLDPADRTADSTSAMVVHVTFKVQGASALYGIEYRFFGRNFYGPLSTPPVGLVPIAPTFCIFTSGEAGSFFWQNGCTRQDAEGVIDFANNKMIFRIPKASLLHRAPEPRESDPKPPPGALPSLLTKGTLVHSWSAETQGSNELGLWSALAFQFHDQVPDGTPATTGYAMAQYAANSQIRILPPERPQGDGQAQVPQQNQLYSSAPRVGDVAILPGEPQAIAIRVQNTMEGKRLINLTASIIEPAGGQGWTARIAPGVEVPGRSTRAASLIVAADASLGHRSSAVIEIRGFSLGHEEERAALRLEVQVTVPPSPTHKTLRFHGAANQGSFSCGTVPVPFFCYQWYTTWMNTLEDDPADTRPDDRMASAGNWGFPPSNGEFNYWSRLFLLDTKAPKPLQFEAGKPVTGTLEFQSRLSYPAELRVSLALAGGDYCSPNYCSVTDTLGSSRQDVTVSTSRTPLDFSFVVDPSKARVTPEQGTLAVRIELVGTQPVPPTYSGLEFFEFLTSGSMVNLPLIPPPGNDQTATSLIGLYPVGDSETLLNPGRTRVLNALVVNEGLEKDRIAVNLTADLGGWLTQVEPAQLYDLAPGQSVNLTLLVKAPDSASNGQIVNLTLNAASQTRKDARNSMHLQAMAIIGHDIPDEAGKYRISEDDRAKAVSEPGAKSPGLGFAAMVAVMLVGLLGLRRRRHSPSSTF
jgi:MYXO-CTERM domain-containing protein